MRLSYIRRQGEITMTETQAMEQIGMIPDAKSVFGKRYKQWLKLCEELRQVNSVKGSLEVESKRLNKLLTEMWADVDAKKVDDSEFTAQLVSSQSSSIKRDLLLENGVPASVIVASTETKPYQFVRIDTTKVVR